jgi:CubicO group peptidase (beta-lactamase class C family)
MKTFVLTLLSFIMVARVIGQSAGTAPAADPEMTADQKISQLLEPYNQPGTPGGILMVMRDGAIICQKAFGMANLQHDISFGENTLTNIGSTSKQFTAFAIALLQKQGRLKVSDDIRKYLPELPDLGHTVTLAHLISHTSGYREFFNTMMMTGIAASDEIRRSEVIPMIQRQPELQNIPGETWNYNNTGYILLAMVVEKVTGESFDKWMNTNVFKPLGMDHTLVRMDPRQVVSGSAQGYAKDDQGNFRELSDLYVSTGAGGIYTTAGDLAKWIGNYFNPVLGDQSLVEQMTTPYVLNSGDKTNYGFGLSVDKLNGLERFQHGGADIAHRSQFFVFPTIRGAVVFLSNNAGIAQDIPVKAAEIYFADVMEINKDDEFNYDQEYVGFDPEKFDDFAGRYSLEPAPDFILEFEREGSKYYSLPTGQPRVEIFPGSDSTFFLKIVKAGITFHRDATGKVNSMTLHQNGRHKANRIMGDAWNPSGDDIAAYSGRYFSEELETWYTVTLNDENQLVLRHRRSGDIQIKPNKPDHFNGSMPIAVVNFVRDEQNRVTGFKASNGRTTNVLFVKQEK